MEQQNSNEQPFFTLMFEPKQILHAIRVLRKFNPGPFANESDDEVKSGIIKHIIRSFNNHDWVNGDTHYFSATAGYWLNFVRYPNSDEPYLVTCTVLIDPYIMILDPDLSQQDTEYAIYRGNDHE